MLVPALGGLQTTTITEKRKLQKMFSGGAGRAEVHISVRPIFSQREVSEVALGLLRGSYLSIIAEAGHFLSGGTKKNGRNNSAPKMFFPGEAVILSWPFGFDQV